LNGSLEVRFRVKTLKVFQDSKKYCKPCRDIVEKQIKKKDSNLASQINGALNSIILNIAEGSADHSDSEFARFLGIAIRSVYETVAGFDLALLYGLVTEEQNEEIESAAHDLVRQLSGFRNSLREK
jgi:four helix bundle protein